MAASVDSEADARKTKEELALSFSVAYGLDAVAFSAATGAFWEEKRKIIHATGFILNPEGDVAYAVYSTGPIGRHTPEDCLRLIDFLTQSK